MSKVVAGLAAAVLALTFGMPVAAATAATDPAGDALYKAPGYMDIVQAELSDGSGTYTFHMTLASVIPSNPNLPPPGVSTISWAFPVDSDPTTSPAGDPFAPGNGQIGPAEFNIRLFWDGGAFSGSILDRRPLLTNGDAILTPLSFSVTGSDVRLLVPAALMDSPATFKWGAVTVYSSPEPGSNSGRHFVDSLEPFYNVWP
jgi:hypothetical protein